MRPTTPPDLRASPASRRAGRHARTILVALLVALAGVLTRDSRAAARDSSAVPAPGLQPAAQSWQTGAFAPDKIQHASLSLSLGAGLGIATRSPAAALGGTLVMGLAKELRDRRHSRFDPADLAAD
ncbi:MAG: hypothetical protein HYR73_01730, partial [Candidatus Eisenbacteria bacterium]|nr:hypothetical protein [Candidatus Eisenbacteria bacterium]